MKDEKEKVNDAVKNAILRIKDDRQVEINYKRKNYAPNNNYPFDEPFKKRKNLNFPPAILAAGELSAGANSCIVMKHLPGLACLGTIGQCLGTPAGQCGLRIP